ncbi:MAG: 50S ribosomal protein L25 [Candidatus Eisenbacteria bacterium]|uniref:Large ribosomal subunit protein bL25 n=1 Tax=Eiseniibacteriota bacterium TaxID=2212470 RepID=A0A9D6L4X0_UNCEI|nr:50S ribosomal protein L25 [Candidatus Eisenbacteria bacterium]MBI3538903.1 50S ribosomal protein L25 [Candidatus Eisenbacteria bacterium]
MAVIPLNAARRESLGKGGARKSRAAGMIPAVLYGHGEDPVAVSVGAREFDVALRQHRGGNPIVNLAVSGQEYTALIRDVQYDPLTHHVLHLDFQHISLTETIEVRVPVRLVGLPIGVKDGGGILETILRDLEVRCLPTAIPPSIDVDVSHLGIGDSVHVRDAKVPDVTILTDGDATVATVVPPTVMEEKAPEEAVAEAAATEPEVIAKGKKEEEGEAAEGAEKKAGDKDAAKEKGKK